MPPLWFVCKVVHKLLYSFCPAFVLGHNAASACHSYFLPVQPVIKFFFVNSQTFEAFVPLLCFQSARLEGCPPSGGSLTRFQQPTLLCLLRKLTSPSMVSPSSSCHAPSLLYQLCSLCSLCSLCLWHFLNALEWKEAVQGSELSGIISLCSELALRQLGCSMLMGCECAGTDVLQVQESWCE
jgi:hypothetical protein